MLGVTGATRVSADVGRKTAHEKAFQNKRDRSCRQPAAVLDRLRDVVGHLAAHWANTDFGFFAAANPFALAGPSHVGLRGLGGTGFHYFGRHWRGPFLSSAGVVLRFELHDLGSIPGSISLCRQQKVS